MNIRFSTSFNFRHSGVGRNPLALSQASWVPAYARMTVAGAMGLLSRWFSSPGHSGAGRNPAVLIKASCILAYAVTTGEYLREGGLIK